MIPTKQRKIIDYFPALDTDGAIFTVMTSLSLPIPWKDYTDGKDMDFAYMYHRSGMKQPSDFFMMMLNNNVVNTSRMANILFTIFGKGWTRLWEDYIAEYKPFDNYNYEEVVHTVRDDNLTIGGSVTHEGSGSTKQKTDTTDTRNLTDTTDYGRTTHAENTQNQNRHGFNSTDAQPTIGASGEQDSNEGGQDVKSYTGTDTVGMTGEGSSTMNNTETKQETHGNKDDDTTTISRTGMSGKSYQDILQSEFALWRWNYFDRIFEDVDKYITLAVFDPCASLFNQTATGGGIYL